MRYLDQHPNQFRLFFGLLAGYLLILAAVTFYQIASRPTDENLFTNPPSNLYVTKTIPSGPSTGAPIKPDEAMHAGDLIVLAGGVPVFDLADLEQELAREPGPETRIDVLRLATGEKKVFRVPKDQLNGESVRDLGPTARVIDVTEEGASDRAGMKVGDLILRINGQNFKNSLDADRILTEAQVGKSLTYDVLRDNQTLSLHVTIAAIGMPFPLLVSTLCGLLFFSVGVFLGFARPRFVAARLSGLAFMTLGYFIMVFLNRRGYAGATLDRIRDVTMTIAVLASIPLTMHAGYYFPRERAELIARKWLIRVAYALSCAGVLATLLFKDYGFLGSLAVLILYSFIVGVAFRKRCSDEYRRLNRVVKNASIVAGAGATLIGCYFGLTYQLQDLGYIGAALVLIPLAHLYTIGRYRLLDLDLRVRRNVQYILVTSLWVVMLGFLAFRVLYWLQGTELPIPNIHFTATSVEVLNTPLQPQHRVWMEKGILMLMSVIVVYASWKVAQRGQKLIDKWFFRAQHDYRRAANELAEVMATKLSMVDLAHGMVEKLSGLLQLKRVGVLFFRDERDCCCQVAFGFDGAVWAEFCITSEATLAQALRELRTESSVDYLPEAIKTEFRRNGFLYVSPIRSKNRLVGVLLVGEKRSEATFHQEDLDFLGVVARQASVAIENAFLYEELAEQERMKHELAIARRIQLASLPQETPKVEGLEIAGASQPALEVGGDYFDYLNGEAGKITIIVGDVSGKGTSAALYLSKVQGILRSLHAFRLSPKELFVRTNLLLYHDMEKSSFVTAISGSFNPPEQTLVVARAGHLPLYHFIAQTRQVEIVTPKGLGLGLEATDLFSSELEERVLSYRRNDVFVFASDGVTEAESMTGGQFGDDRLRDLVARYSSENAQSILDRIMEAVRDFAGEGEQRDDQTVVVVKAL
jgi:serine phosphatase RsbU (regulator of sigma subunit)